MKLHFWRCLNIQHKMHRFVNYFNASLFFGANVMLKELKDSPKLQEFKSRHPTTSVIVTILGIIMLWRGFWALLDIFIFPGSPLLSGLTCIALGAVILYLDDFRIDNLKR